MDDINTLELSGTVGVVKVADALVNKVALSFSLCTKRYFETFGDEKSCEDTWLTCFVFQDRDGKRPVKNGRVHLKGRLRMARYTDYNGGLHMETEVFVTEFLEIEEPIQNNQPD